MAVSMADEKVDCLDKWKAVQLVELRDELTADLWDERKRDERLGYLSHLAW